MAGFEVTLHGRIWVIPEAPGGCLHEAVFKDEGRLAFPTLCRCGLSRAVVATHELGEELVGSYLYQVHLHHWLESNDYGRFLTGNDKRMGGRPGSQLGPVFSGADE
jgi:hypothetical protein